MKDPYCHKKPHTATRSRFFCKILFDGFRPPAPQPPNFFQFKIRPMILFVLWKQTFTIINHPKIK